MTKALTALALVLVCIAAASVAYYFGGYLPRFHDAELAEQRSKTDLENARRCNMDALKFYADFQREMLSTTPAWDGYWLDPEMHFNRKLNTCLVEIRWDHTTDGDLYRTTSVSDVYSNREIIDAYYKFEHGEPKSAGQGIGGMDPKKYLAEKDKLFGE
jgi:hypothetical protein